MGRRRDPIELVRTEGAEHFAFLVSDEGFDGPAPTEGGIRYQRADVAVVVSFGHFNFRDMEVSTRFEVPAEAGSRPRRIRMEDLYIARGLGTPQDVPGGAQTLHALSKHLAVQAQILKRLLAFLAAQDCPGSWSQL